MSCFNTNMKPTHTSRRGSGSGEVSTKCCEQQDSEKRDLANQTHWTRKPSLSSRARFNLIPHISKARRDGREHKQSQRRCDRSIEPLEKFQQLRCQLRCGHAANATQAPTSATAQVLATCKPTCTLLLSSSALLSPPTVLSPNSAHWHLNSTRLQQRTPYTSDTGCQPLCMLYALCGV